MVQSFKRFRQRRNMLWSDTAATADNGRAVVHLFLPRRDIATG
ncbi:hypothetical protein HMPREF9996_00857 [Aggregatibacter actinomycetemcomitans Y4]|nr:hypothetical protein HMPREF9996_00857 [Aggregatibacter actinomycetemcomitans Y4]